ncbi:MAG TPA: glycoside hydrolase family 3 N-terminal domain-containing protein [Chitinophagaceae bacterium]|jgi:beta-glucosidase-like glycosyl hydrolase/CubicO group peptidase (beta-lactamase class C family)|nr:glycoside hydrolase family 3 N-terminal domain-containing protein [Chitinophagaceae bacterium]
MKKFLLPFVFLFTQLIAVAQYKSNLNVQQWTDSVFKSLSDDEKIAQLMVIRAFSTKPDDIAKIADLIKTYNVGALCFFQGGPIRQATATNYYQSIAKTPLLVTIDGEWGLGMRLDSVTKYPYQLTLGALPDPNLIYQMGIAVGEQCKRIGVQVNFAPVVDINNNPNNPVIGFRSFGEDKNKVTQFGLAYMKGMQDAGIMACAKHFPGHGDVDVDSHLDLPVINKSMDQLDSLELVPFKALFNAGVGSVMIAHLYIPAIDNTANTATSLSKNNVTDLLRNKLGYQGLTFTDALEMKGVAKYWPGGEAAVQALIAGNDMLCLPESVPDAIDAIKKAISQKRLTWDDINNKVKKILLSKYDLGLSQWKPVDTTNLVNDLNQKTNAICYEVAKKTITVLNGSSILPESAAKIAYVGIGALQPNLLSERLKEDRNADCYFISYTDSVSNATRVLDSISNGKYDAVVIGIHGFTLRPSNNYGITDTVMQLWNQLQAMNSVTLVFGNVLATKNFCAAKNLIACYQDDDITQQVAADLLEGTISTEGTLPVSVCEYKYGAGIMQKAVPVKLTIEQNKFAAVDSIAEDAISQKAFPGCVILAAHNGEIVYHKAFGSYKYEPSPAMNFGSIFDLASVTKVSATNISIMRLYDEGKIDLNKTLGDYLPWTKGTDKAHLKIHDILLHQAGLIAFIPFYREVVDTATGLPDPAVFSDKQKPGFTVRVAENVYLRNDWEDTMFHRILKSKLGPTGKYVYSDNDFIFLGKIVEALTGMTLDQYVQKTFYNKMGLETTGFKPRNRFPVNRMVPTETDEYFRHQTIQGDVHDEGASMFGGVAGHAGLFSDAYDLAMLYQMLANGGAINGERFINSETIKLFSAYHSEVSRRGYGFDKPEKDNATRKEPYPSSLASPETFGHTGFTGTCVWVDPKYNIVYVFLCNRVYPTRNDNKLLRMNIRGKIQDAIYRALGI